MIWRPRRALKRLEERYAYLAFDYAELKGRESRLTEEITSIVVSDRLAMNTDGMNARRLQYDAIKARQDAARIPDA
jgi:hypothetical protein